MPKTARAISVRPAPTSPANARISPARRVNDTSLKTPSREVLDFENNVADLGRQLRKELLDVTADHLANDLVDRHVSDSVSRDVGTVAHDGDLVAECEHLIEAVGDEQHRRTGVAQTTRNREEAFDLHARERGSGLVHDEHASIHGNRLGDLDDLLVGDRETLGETVRIDRDTELGEELSGIAPHARTVDQTETVSRLPTDEDVLGDGEVGKERRLLIDDGDPGVFRLGSGVEVDDRTAEAVGSAIETIETGDDLDEGRLSCAVLADEGVDRA